MNLKQKEGSTLIGGIINMFLWSMFILSPINTLLLVSMSYERYFSQIPLYIFIISSIIVFSIWEYICFTRLYPSSVKQSNNQYLVPGRNRMMDKIDEMDKKIDEINNKLS